MERTLQYLPVHQETLYRMVKDKRLSAVRINNRWYFDPAAVAHFIRKRQTVFTNKCHFWRWYRLVQVGWSWSAQSRYQWAITGDSWLFTSIH
jgi:excisionase family DNA binding protein